MIRMEKKYLDANSGLWNMPLGYSNTSIKEAVKQQMEKVPYVNPEMFNNEKSEELASLMTDILGKNYTKILYTCTGSECVELGIKIARKYNSLTSSKRNLIGIFENSYHGTYYGAMSATEFESKWQKGYGPMLEGFVELGGIYEHDLEDNDEQQSGFTDNQKNIINNLEMLKDELAAVIVEPIQASGGVLIFTKELLSTMCKICNENNILVIFDEIATGFGRTGSMFKFQTMEVEPDIILMSKGINNGYFPLGAVAVKDFIVQVFHNKRMIINHMSTQNTNPVCCAAAIVTIKQLRDNDYEYLTVVKEKSKYFNEKLLALKKTHMVIRYIRSSGMCFALDLGNNKPINAGELGRMLENLKEKGILCTASYTQDRHAELIFFLPFIITYEEMDYILYVLADVLY